MANVQRRDRARSRASHDPTRDEGGRPAQRGAQSAALSRCAQAEPSMAPQPCASNTRRGFMESIIDMKETLS
jgi:hypothetical protein